MSMNPETEIMHQRLDVLELAGAHGNLAYGRWQRGVSRTMLDEYKRRFRTHGPEDLMLTHHSHLLTILPEVEERILALSLVMSSRSYEALSILLRAMLTDILFKAIAPWDDATSTRSRYSW